MKFYLGRKIMNNKLTKNVIKSIEFYYVNYVHKIFEKRTHTGEKPQNSFETNDANLNAKKL